MSLVRWDPFADMAQLREQMNRLFEQSLSRVGTEPTATSTWAPAVDILETENELILRAELPGVNPDDITIRMEGETLTLRGDRRVEKAEKDWQYVRVERAYGTFQRSFTLGLRVQQDQIHATYRDGVLEVILPKAEEVKPRQIKVNVERALT